MMNLTLTARLVKKLKIRKTTKLHYGKYLYKVNFKNDLSHCFASFRNTPKDRLSYAKNVINDLKQKAKDKEPLATRFWRTMKLVEPSDHQYASNILALLSKHSDWRARVELNRFLTIYTSNEDLVDGLSKNCGAHEVYKPEEGMENFLLLNIDTAVVNKPSKYEYRVYIKSDSKQEHLANWLKANTDKSRVGAITLYNLETGWHMSGNYFYIRDDRVLTMVRMVAGNNINRVEKLIYKGDIDKYMHGNE